MVIENQSENRMVKQWVQPHTSKMNATWRFLLGSHLTSFTFYVYYCGFHWNIRGKLRNSVFGNMLKEFNQI